MDKKKFLLNITIQIDAHDEDEALEILTQEEILKSIAKAIVENKDNIQEMTSEQTPKIIN